MTIISSVIELSELLYKHVKPRSTTYPSSLHLIVNNASSVNSSSKSSRVRKRDILLPSLFTRSSHKHPPSGSFFPKGGLPLQSQVSNEPVRVPCAFDDAQDTNTVVVSFITAGEETRATLLIHINEIIDKFDTDSATLETVRELVILGRIPVWDTFKRITEKLLKAIKVSILLQTTALQGLAVVLNSCPEEIDMKGKEGFYSDILVLLQTRLDTARAIKNESELIPLLYAIIALLSAMQYREVGGLDSDRIFNPLKSSFEKLGFRKDSTVIFLSMYAKQSLFHVGSNESLEKSIFRHGLLAIRIAVDIASGIKNVNLEKFESAFQSIMKMNNFSIKDSWYKGLVLLDSTIYVQDWTKFEELVFKSKFKSEHFLQGACLRLEQIAGTQPNQDVRDGAIKFLRYILENPPDNVQHIAHAALGRLGVCHCEIHSDSDIQQHTVSTTCGCTAPQNVQNGLPAIWDLSWHSESTATLLRRVQQERRSHMMIEDTATTIVEMKGDLSKLLDSTISLCSLDEVRHALAVYYKDSLKVLRVSGDELELDSCYVNLAIVEASSQRIKEKSDLKSKAKAFQRMPSRGESTNVNMELFIPLEQLFDKRKLQDGNEADPKRILIYGRAGVGKSTLCKKIVHLFQAGKWRDRFDAILWLSLRHIKDCNFHTISDMLSKWYFASQLDPVKLSRTLQNSRVLFILDGLDEIVTVLRTNRNLMKFFKVLLQQEHILITSRPSGVDKSILPGVELELETVGFIPQNVKDYLSIVLSPDQGQSVQRFIDQTPVVQGLVNIPVQLDVICFSWDSLPANVEDITITDLYQAMVCKLCRKDAFKLQRKSGEELLSEYDIDKLHPREIYILMDPELEYLSYLAFQGLKDNHRIEFDEKWMCDIFMDLNRNKPRNESIPSVLLVNRLKEMSFLHSADLNLNVNARNFDACWHFLHLTSQEYFAATWIVQCIQGNSSDGTGAPLQAMKEFILKEKYNPRYEIVWWMVAGQLKGNALVSFFDILQGAPMDLIGGYHHHLLAACLKESRSELDKVNPGRVESLESQLTEWLQFEKSCFDRNGTGGFRRSILGTMGYVSEELMIKSISQSEDSSKYLIQTLGRRHTITPSAIQILLKGLQQKNEDVRDAAAKTLGNQSKLPDSALCALIDALRDENWNVRDSAVSALGKQSILPDSALQALVGALQDKDRDVRYSAASALGKQSGLPDSILQGLIGSLQHENEDVRKSAARALEKQSKLPDSALRALIDALHDGNEEVRVLAASALGKQSKLPDSTLQALIDALQDENEDIRFLAASALGKQSTLPGSVLQALIGLLQYENEDVRKSAASALGKRSKLPGSALQALIGALQDENEDVGLLAAFSLGNQSTLPDSALQALIDVLKDENVSVRRSAAFTLRRQQSLPDSVLQALIGSLQYDIEYARMPAAFVLGNQPTLPDSVTQFLIDTLQDRNVYAKISAAFVLGNQLTLPHSALQVLIDALQDENEDVRFLAASALEKQSTLPDSVLQDLIGALHDKDRDVMYLAVSTLEKQSKLPDSILQDLIGFLQHENEDVRKSAASILGKQSKFPDSALRALIDALQDDSEYIRELTVISLGNQLTLSDSALQALIDALQDENEKVRFSATYLLGNQSELSDSILQALIVAIQDEDWSVRDSAASALGNRFTLPASALQAIIGALQYKRVNKDVSKILEQHAKLTFMAIPGLPSSSIEILYTAFLVFYGSQYSAALWAQDNQIFFYTAQGFEKVQGLCVEDIERVVNAFEAAKNSLLKNN
ncbi:hypothetical protein BGZ49_009725 [Haplosporangium sp. Z 27]|nr:hypothetical protein BGZ49_009725 [Haplosporangium sp. Z 27]